MSLVTSQAALINRAGSSTKLACWLFREGTGVKRYRRLDISQLEVMNQTPLRDSPSPAMTPPGEWV